MSPREIAPQSTAKRLRILHVLEATLGGTLRYLNDIILASDSSMYDYGIAYATERADPDLGLMLERARLTGWRTFPMEMVRAVTPKKDVRAVMTLMRIICEFNPDILHCHSSKAGAIGRLGRLLSRKYPRVVYSPHAIAASLGRQYLLIEKLLRPLTARYSAVSESERNELVSLELCRQQNVDIVYPTIDTAHFEAQQQQSARSQLSIATDADVVVGVGRLVRQKNPLFFLDVVRQALRHWPSLRAIWIGEGEMRAEVEAAIVAQGLSGIVTLAGWQPDVRPYIAASDLLLSTSLYESFGYMVAESFAMERPVVASNVTGTRDIMSGQLAPWLYTPGDSIQAAELIGAFLSDTVKADEVGVLGREQMKSRFNREAMKQSLDVVYQRAIRS